MRATVLRLCTTLSELIALHTEGRSIIYEDRPVRREGSGIAPSCGAEPAPRQASTTFCWISAKTGQVFPVADYAQGLSNALWVKHSQAGTFTVRLDGFIMLYGSAGTNAFTFAWKGPRAPCGAMLPCKSPPDPPERHSVFVV